MLYINGIKCLNYATHISRYMLNDQPADVLIITLPLDSDVDAGSIRTVTDEQVHTITRYTVRMHYDTRTDEAHAYLWLLLDGYTIADNPAYHEAKAQAAQMENTELLNLLGTVAQTEYENAMEEIQNV